MATYITEECINCGACEPECPNEAISEGDDIYVIDPKLCTECVGFHDHEACQAVCPVECCLPEPNRDGGRADHARQVAASRQGIRRDVSVALPEERLGRHRHHG